MNAFSRWLVAEVQQDRTKYRDIREVIYSPDGKTVTFKLPRALAG